jgi:voltage-gated potassium channel
VSFRRLSALLLAPIAILTAGTLGYMLVEGWSAFDALYMTVMTVTTVGFSEVHPLSTGGKVFTIFLMLGGIFVLFYAAGELIRIMISGQIQQALGRQRMEHALAELRDHIIVCGYGRMGKLVCREFSSQEVPFVVVERAAEPLEHFKMPYGLPLHGDATSDEILKTAGIDRARALVAVLPSDADNLYITMSARLLNERLFIVARAEDERAEQKLHRAGASRVVSPYAMGGYRVAHAVLRPTVVDFLDQAIRSEHLEMQIEEIQIASHSRLVGTAIKDTNVRQQLGIIIVAIKRATGAMVFNPPPDAVLGAGDILIAIGHTKQLEELDKLAQD